MSVMDIVNKRLVAHSLPKPTQLLLRRHHGSNTCIPGSEGRPMLIVVEYIMKHHKYSDTREQRELLDRVTLLPGKQSRKPFHHRKSSRTLSLTPSYIKAVT
jgi:hypothetical protein